MDIIPEEGNPGGMLLMNKNYMNLYETYRFEKAGFNPPLKPPKPHAINEKIKKDDSRVCVLFVFFFCVLFILLYIEILYS